MCYEYDELFERARIAEQVRREMKLKDKQTDAAKPVEPKTGVKEQQPVPA